MTEKIQAAVLPKMIADAIEHELQKHSTFNSTSVAYFGVDIHFRIEVTTYARAEQKVIAEKMMPTIGTKEGEKETLIVEGAKTTGSKPAPKVSPNGEMPAGEMGTNLANTSAGTTAAIGGRS
jgi:hypothetical protein